MTAHDTAMVPTPPGSPPAGTGGRRGPHPRLWPGRRISSGSPVQARSAKQPVGGSFAPGGACSCAHDRQDSRLLREGSYAATARSLSLAIPPSTWRRIEPRGVIRITAGEGAILYALYCSNGRGEAPSGRHRAEAILPASARRLFTRRAAARMPRPIVRSPACQDARPRP